MSPATLIEEAAAAEREAAAIFGNIAAAREPDAYRESALIPAGFEADAERASSLIRHAAHVRALAAPSSPPHQSSPSSQQPPPSSHPAPAKKEVPAMALPHNVLRAERQRCTAIIGEAARLGLSGEITDAAIRSGLSADDFTAQNDPTVALASEILAAAQLADA